MAEFNFLTSRRSISLSRFHLFSEGKISTANYQSDSNNNIFNIDKGKTTSFLNFNHHNPIGFNRDIYGTELGRVRVITNLVVIIEHKLKFES